MTDFLLFQIVHFQEVRKKQLALYVTKQISLILVILWTRTLLVL